MVRDPAAIKLHLASCSQSKEMCQWIRMCSMWALSLESSCQRFCAGMKVTLHVLGGLQALKSHHRQLQTPASGINDILGFYHKQNDLIDDFVEVRWDRSPAAHAAPCPDLSLVCKLRSFAVVLSIMMLSRASTGPLHIADPTSRLRLGGKSLARSIP